MKKNNIIIFIILIFIFEILTNSQYIMSSVKTSFDIWKNNLFPALFPMFVFSSILIDFGIIEVIEKSKNKFLNKIFNINSSSIFILIMSIFSGFPSSAKYIKELYEKKLINKYEAEKIILFSHFSNPMFIIGTISLSFLNNKNLCFIIIFSHYIVNILIGIFLRNYHKNEDNDNNDKIIKKEIPIGTSITNSILNSINTLLLILGTVTFFLIITTIIDINFNLPLNIKTFIFSITEMTQGIKHISLLNISLKLKCVFISMLLSFGGLSVHLQTFSIINDLKLKYKNYLIARIIHSILSGILVLLFYDIFY